MNTCTFMLCMFIFVAQCSHITTKLKTQTNLIMNPDISIHMNTASTMHNNAIIHFDGYHTNSNLLECLYECGAKAMHGVEIFGMQFICMCTTSYCDCSF